MIVRLSDMVPGHKMCCICFEYIPVEDLFVDPSGQKWDLCNPCNAYQEVISGLLSLGYSKNETIALLRDLTRYLRPDRIEP